MEWNCLVIVGACFFLTSCSVLSCSQKLSDCAGHFGYVQLEMPVFHAGYFKHTLAILQCICKQCSKVLLPLDDRASLLRKITNPKSDALIKSAIFKKIVETCKKASRCQHCDYANGVVKKLTSGFFKIAHEKFRAKNAADEDDQYQQRMEQIYQTTPELRQFNVKSSVSRTYKWSY
jgi:DNA-directed RNA polymerase III subunit RPC1